ncbi:MAG TPA: sigma-70 family RNA polymerase sigma factor [Gammaproteobacteria bacterium]|nr:sigma-70 family RNA polymerase sigma factor [Gammaproteobacteria bacterium]
MSANAATKNDNARLTDLLHGCAQGRQAALQSLYADLAPQLFPLLVRILKRPDLAEEAVQDTFIRVWRHASEYTAAKGSVRTWVLSIGRYRALDMLRRERREVHWEPEAIATALAEGDNETDETDVTSLAEQRALRECLGRLSEGQLSSIRLAYFNGQTHEEIAAALESPIGTVKSWVRRGLASLKRCLER